MSLEARSRSDPRVNMSRSAAVAHLYSLVQKQVEESSQESAAVISPVVTRNHPVSVTFHPLMAL